MMKLRTFGRSGAAALLVSALLHPDAGAQARWRLQEIARVGGAEEGLTSFNEIRDLQLDAKGQVWVLDAQVQSLRLIAADGKSVRELGRKGKGPGEITQANGIQRAPDGRMVLRDHSNGGFQLYNPDGSEAGRVLVNFGGYGYWWIAGIDSAARVAEDWSVRRGTDEAVPALIRRTLSGATIDTVDRPAGCESRPLGKGYIRFRNGFSSIPFYPEVRLAFAPSGALWCGRNDEYLFRRFALGATAAEVEVRGGPATIPLSRFERDSALEVVDSTIRARGGAVEPWSKSMMPKARPAIRRIESDDEGRLWVLRESPTGPLELDVWDARGRRLAVLTTPFRRRDMSLFRVYRDRIAMRVLDENDVPTIVIARIVR